jgi:membrane-associated phospholipid phosphatase
MLKVQNCESPIQLIYHFLIFSPMFYPEKSSMRNVFTLALFVLYAHQLVAQEDSLAVASTPWHAVAAGDGRTVVHGAVYLFGAPCRWEAKEWGDVGLTALATGGAVLLDDEVYSVMLHNRSTTLDHISNVVVNYGDGFVLGVLCLGTYGTGLVVKDSWLRETAVLSGTALLLASLSTQVLKIAVGRARPYMGLGNTAFRPFQLEDGYESFPSGHTAAAFSVTAVLAARIDRPWASIGLYTLATLTGLSRIYTENHWFSDVLFSAIFSASIGRSLVLWYEGSTEENNRSGLSILPSPQGMTVMYRF